MVGPTSAAHREGEPSTMGLPTTQRGPEQCTAADLLAPLVVDRPAPHLPDRGDAGEGVRGRYRRHFRHSPRPRVPCRRAPCSSVPCRTCHGGGPGHEPTSGHTATCPNCCFGHAVSPPTCETAGPVRTVSVGCCWHHRAFPRRLRLPPPPRTGRRPVITPLGVSRQGGQRARGIRAGHDGDLVPRLLS